MSVPENSDPAAAVDSSLTDWKVSILDVPVTGKTLRHPAVLQSVALTLALAVAAFWPATADSYLFAAIVSTIATGVAFLIAPIAQHRLGIADITLTVSFVVGAIVLVVYPGESGRTIAYVWAFLLVIFAIHNSLPKRYSEDNRRFGGANTALGITALFIALFPESAFSLITVILTIFTGIVTMITIRQLELTPYQLNWPISQRDLVSQWLDSRTKDSTNRSALYQKVLFDGDDAYDELVRFSVLMGFASVIASFGIIVDSTATVIGAMLVAPLMMPLMGVAVSLTMGWPRHLARAAVIASAGALLSIGIGLLAGLAFGSYVDVTTNSQIIARVSPSLLDLFVAIAAGAAGAYGLSHSDALDALPGVAIAIALVPPLSVVGICLAQGEWLSALGALLLFFVNALCIVAVGALVFVMTGISTLDEAFAGSFRVRQAGAAIGLLTVFVLGMLLFSGNLRLVFSSVDGQMREEVTQWAEEYSEFELQDTEISEDGVTVTLFGPDEASVPDPEELQTSLNELTNIEWDVTVKVIEMNQATATSQD